MLSYKIKHELCKRCCEKARWQKLNDRKDEKIVSQRKIFPYLEAEKAGKVLRFFHSQLLLFNASL